MDEIVRRRLHHALLAARLIATHVAAQTYEGFVNDAWWRGAAERQLETIGEALNSARRQQPELEEEIPNLHAWVSLRHFIAHQYDRIDMQIIWETMTLEDELPLLIEMLTWLLDNEANGSVD